MSGQRRQNIFLGESKLGVLQRRFTVVHEITGSRI